MNGFSLVLRPQIVTLEEALQLRDHIVRLPARRDDAFKKAKRESFGGRLNLTFELDV